MVRYVIQEKLIQKSLTLNFINRATDSVNNLFLFEFSTNFLSVWCFFIEFFFSLTDFFTGVSDRKFSMIKKTHVIEDFLHGLVCFLDSNGFFESTT